MSAARCARFAEVRIPLRPRAVVPSALGARVAVRPSSRGLEHARLDDARRRPVMTRTFRHRRGERRGESVLRGVARIDRACTSPRRATTRRDARASFRGTLPTRARRARPAPARLERLARERRRRADRAPRAHGCVEARRRPRRLRLRAFTRAARVARGPVVAPLGPSSSTVPLAHDLDGLVVRDANVRTHRGRHRRTCESPNGFARSKITFVVSAGQVLQRLESPQLHTARRRVEDACRLGEVLRALEVGLALDDDVPSIPLGDRLAAITSCIWGGSWMSCRPISSTCNTDCETNVSTCSAHLRRDLLAVGEQIVELRLADDVAQNDLRAVVNGGLEVLTSSVARSTSTTVSRRRHRSMP